MPHVPPEAQCGLSLQGHTRRLQRATREHEEGDDDRRSRRIAIEPVMLRTSLDGRPHPDLAARSASDLRLRDVAEKIVVARQLID